MCEINGLISMIYVLRESYVDQNAKEQHAVIVNHFIYRLFEKRMFVQPWAYVLVYINKTIFRITLLGIALMTIYGFLL